VTSRFAPERHAYLFTNPSNIRQVEIAIDLAGSPHADKRQFRSFHGSNRVLCGSQAAVLDRRCDDLAYFGLNDRGSASVDQFDLCLGSIDSDHLVPALGEATCRHDPYIP
jgi:hypothetical protein